MPIELPISAATLYGFLLVLARVGGAFLFVPIPGARQGPEMARIILSLGCTMALYPLWPAPQDTAPDLGKLVLWMFSEAAFGITAGVAVAFLNESFLIAAQIFGLQAGYSYASMIDPGTEADSNVLAVFSQFLAGLFFFALGLHREVIRVFARSLEVFPPGSYALKTSTAGAMIELGAQMFSMGLRLAMPVIALLLLVDLALALMGRINAHLQLLQLAFPVKMLSALAILAVAVRLFFPVYESASGRTFSELMRVLNHGG